jgi:pimeloyl-ACP methyl ester carboxylesterase
VAISVTGLGTLTNRIASLSSPNPTISQIQSQSAIQLTNTSKAVYGTGLTQINGKPLHYQSSGSSSGPPIVFIHGLGGSLEAWSPLITAAKLDQSHSLHRFDLEGQGLSPTSPTSVLSIASFAADLNSVVDMITATDGVTLIAHSMGCHVAIKFAIQHPDKVKNLILLGTPPTPLPEAASKAFHARSHAARTQGMAAVVDAVAAGATSELTKTTNPVAHAAVRMSLLGQDPECYAKGCSAMANSTDAMDLTQVRARTRIVTGSEDKVSPPEMCEKYSALLPQSAGVAVLKDTGHWFLFEDVKALADAIVPCV